MRPCPLCNSRNVLLFWKIDAHRLARCRSCGFVYHGNPPALEVEEQNYEAYFAQAEPDEESLRRSAALNQQRLDRIRRFVPFGRLLDVGCGRGFFLAHAQNAGYNVEGVDISLNAARYASEMFGLKVKIGNLEEGLQLDGSYDVITLWHSLEHFQKPLGVLSLLRRHTASGGRLFIEVPNFNGLAFRSAPPSKRWRGGNHPRFHRSFFTSKTLSFALQKAGFSVQFYDPRYPAQPLKQGLKSLLNRFNADSFLNVTAAPL